MCENGKCCCLEVETGALIFAIPNLFNTALGTASCTGFLIYINMAMNAAMNRKDKPWMQSVFDKWSEESAVGTLSFGMTANYVLSIVLVVNVIALAFAICLIVGICKRNPNLVKAYFVSGVMLLCIWGIIGLIATIKVHAALGLPGLGGFIIYGLILNMIRLTYIKFQGEIITSKHFANRQAVIQKF